jgi:hypothetical protein
MPPKWIAGDIRGWRERGAINNNISMDKDPLCEEQVGDHHQDAIILLG